uniref:Uncharacterized protein n=1 Tax=Strongyloides venezuelensis TaxID=75913 RepID=A0A0K0G5L8_STRVS
MQKLEESFNDIQPIYYDIKTVVIRILEWIEIDEKGGKCQRLDNLLLYILNEIPTLNLSTEVFNNLFQVIKDKFEESINELLIDVESAGTDFLITLNHFQSLIEKNHNGANYLVINILNFKFLFSKHVFNSLINDKNAKKY